MTGEMFESDVTREAYPLHFAIADAVKGEVRPFDQYQGPYVLVGTDIRLGRQPYQYCPVGLGVVRLWIISEDGCGGYIYNEATEKTSEPFPLDLEFSGELAADLARDLLAS